MVLRLDVPKRPRRFALVYTQSGHNFGRHRFRNRHVRANHATMTVGVRADAEAFRFASNAPTNFMARAALL